MLSLRSNKLLVIYNLETGQPVSISLVDQGKQMAAFIRMPFCFCGDDQMIAKNNRGVTGQNKAFTTPSRRCVVRKQIRYRLLFVIAGRMEHKGQKRSKGAKGDNLNRSRDKSRIGKELVY